MKTGKSAVSSQREKLVRRSATIIQSYAKTSEFKRDLERIAAIRDEDIDFSDVPEQTGEELAMFRPIKKSVTARIDADVIAWLQSKPGHYQTNLNEELRKAMSIEQHSRTNAPTLAAMKKARRKNRQD